MNNLRRAGICKRVNRRKKLNANNCSSLHELIARLSRCVPLVGASLSFGTDSGSTDDGGDIHSGMKHERMDGVLADVGAEVHYSYMHLFAQVFM